MNLRLALALIAAASPLQGTYAQTLLTPQAIFDRAKAASVVVLAGEGSGRLTSIATGVLISKDGVILTALHAIKGAQEVQVRCADGEVYDRVELLGSDERRDIAALKIAAVGLPALSTQDNATLTAGDPVYAVTNANGLTWSATQGILSAIRLADEVQGAGTGFRMLQFTAPIAPGSSGGALLDRSGALSGIIIGAFGNSAFAVPVGSVIGLPQTGMHTLLGTGSALKMPVTSQVEEAQIGAAVAGANPTKIVQNAKTIYIHSKTSFLTVDTVDRALELEKTWPKLRLTIVQDPRVADLEIELDRPLFTYVHTFVITDRKSSIVLDSGKVTAFDGTIASGGIAKDVVKYFSSIRIPVSESK